MLPTLACCTLNSPTLPPELSMAATLMLKLFWLHQMWRIYCNSAWTTAFVTKLHSRRTVHTGYTLGNHSRLFHIAINLRDTSLNRHILPGKNKNWLYNTRSAVHVHQKNTGQAFVVATSCMIYTQCTGLCSTDREHPIQQTWMAECHP